MELANNKIDYSEIPKICIVKRRQDDYLSILCIYQFFRMQNDCCIDYYDYTNKRNWWDSAVRTYLIEEIRGI